MTEDEHKKADFLSKSPFGLLPVLQVDNFNYLYEANVICRFLSSKNDKVILIGTDLNGSLVEQWLEIESTSTPDLLLQKLNLHLSSLENKNHIVATRQSLSMADIVVWSTLYFLLSSGSNKNQREKYPVAAQWFDALIAENEKFFNQAIKLAKL